MAQDLVLHTRPILIIIQCPVAMKKTLRLINLGRVLERGPCLLLCFGGDSGVVLGQLDYQIKLVAALSVVVIEQQSPGVRAVPQLEMLEAENAPILAPLVLHEEAKGIQAKQLPHFLLAHVQQQILPRRWLLTQYELGLEWPDLCRDGLVGSQRTPRWAYGRQVPYLQLHTEHLLCRFTIFYRCFINIIAQSKNIPLHCLQQQMDKEEVHSSQSQDQTTSPAVYISEPHEYLAVCQKDKKVKIMDERNPILPHVYLKDISLHKKGPLEDKIYSKNNKYYYNIRRGNTLCQVYDAHSRETALFMCRRGMKKFYDLEPEYLRVGRKLTHQHQRFRNRIFQQIEKFMALHQGKQYKIHLYGLFKENGEHCQISYIRQLGYWLFASKNVSILAKTEADLDNFYEKQRFYWAKLIGREFFKILAEFTPQQKQQFIGEIEGKTLLGQHCGNEEHQHITKYEGVEMIFYGLVDNNETEHCLPVEVCQKFLLKYGLKMSKIEKIEGITEENKLYAHMYTMLKRIAEGTMQECGQGSVLYIIGQEPNNGPQHTLSLCKLKTCEYLIYRKMREMIKVYFAKKGATANSFEKYKFQIDNLCESYFKPPRKMEVYYRMGELAFEEVRKNGDKFATEEFRYRFVKFLEDIETKMRLEKEEEQQKGKNKRNNQKIVLICPPLLQQQQSRLQKVCKSMQMPIQYGYRQGDEKNKAKLSALYLCHMVPRLNFDQVDPGTKIVSFQPKGQQIARIVSELEAKPNVKRSHLINFVKCEDKGKAIQLLNEKISAFVVAYNKWGESKKQQTNIQFLEVKGVDQVISQLQNVSASGPQTEEASKISAEQPKLITVVITLVIPGSGKSSLVQAFTCLNQNQQRNIQVIQSDKIRESVMQKYMGKRKGDEVEMQRAFAATKKKGLQKYRQAVEAAFGEQAPAEPKIVFIDRVFCPTTVLENIKQIAKPWTRFVIVTQTQVPTKLNDYLYPHSMTYLLSCIKRCLQRQGHETLSQKPHEIVRVLLKFYQMYRGFAYNKLVRQLEEESIEFSIVPLQFVQEREGENLFLKKKVEECLKGVSPGHEAPQSNLYGELIELIYKFSDHIEVSKGGEEDEEKKIKFLAANAQKLLKYCK